MAYGNTRVGGRSIFSTRKVRSNKGVPRKRLLAPSNVVVVNAGGQAVVQAAPRTRTRKYGPRKPRSNKGVKRTRVSSNSLNAIAMRSLFAEPKGYYKRKTRSNKGVKRGPRYLPRSTNLFA